MRADKAKKEITITFMNILLSILRLKAAKKYNKSTNKLPVERLNISNVNCFGIPSDR